VDSGPLPCCRKKQILRIRRRTLIMTQGYSSRGGLLWMKEEFRN